MTMTLALPVPSIFPHTSIPAAYRHAAWLEDISWWRDPEHTRSMSGSPVAGRSHPQSFSDNNPRDRDRYPLQLPPLREVVGVEGEAPRILPLPTVEPQTRPLSPSSLPGRPGFLSHTTVVNEVSPSRDGARALDNWQPSFSPIATAQIPRPPLVTPLRRAANDHFVSPVRRERTSSLGSHSTHERRSPKAGLAPITHSHSWAPALRGPSSSSIQESSMPERVASVHRPGSLWRTFMDEAKPMLRIRQQPKACRACGWGERDRRVIDPPPILALKDPDHELSASKISIVHTSLWNENGEQDVTHAQPSNRRLGSNLMGNLAASNINAKDDRGRDGTFFVFTDLSCRIYGRYRLRFSLVKIPLAPVQVGTTAPIVEHVMSEVFTVYSAKEFPGMRPSSALAICLKQQGYDIPLKKGKRSGLAEPSDEEGESDPEARRTKRRKT